MAMGKKRFMRILEEEGLKNKDLRRRLWNSRPDDSTTESELREMVKVTLEEERASMVTVAFRSDGADFIFQCEKCRTVLARGKYAVGLELRGEHLLVGEKPPRQCCGAEVLVAPVYQSMEAAEQAMAEVIQGLQAVGDTSELCTLRVEYLTH